VRGCPRRECMGDVDFSKVNNIVNLYGRFVEGLTFENVYH